MDKGASSANKSSPSYYLFVLFQIALKYTLNQQEPIKGELGELLWTIIILDILTCDIVPVWINC